MILSKAKKILHELDECSTRVANSLRGGKLRISGSMLYCILRYGARPIDYERFEFHRKSHRERNRYMTIMRYFKIAKRIDHKVFKEISGKKKRELELFKDFVNRDWMSVDAKTSDKDIKAFIRNHGELIAKPSHGEQGHGVFKIKSSTDIETILQEKDKEEFILEEVLENADYIKEINPSSLNTLRVYTFIDKNEQLHILNIMLRVGAPGSHVDNWGSGGVGYHFDLETGVCDMPGKDKLNKEYIYHPGSNVKMLGFQLKDFDKLKQYVADLNKVVPKARYTGWDIAVTPKGFELVEMNCPGGHDFLQTFGHPWYDFIKKNW